MSVPARPERDADLVLSAAADEIERLRAQTRGDAAALRMIADALGVPEDERHDGVRAITNTYDRDAETLETELAICREAIETCLDVVENLPSDDDGAAAVKRCTLRRLNEAIGKAVPRLMMERPEGQKMYGLNYREMRQRIEADCTAMQQALDALELCRLNGSQYLYGNERDIVFSAIKTLRKRLK
jgi:hypothetical protein